MNWLIGKLLNKYVLVGGAAFILALVASLGVQTYRLQLSSEREKGLKTQVSELTEDLKAEKNQVAALVEREGKYKRIEANYDKLRAELKGKQNGPVADVLRYAIDADVVQ